MDIRQARVDEYERVLKFYNDVLDGLEGAKYHPRWQKGIYPTEASLRAAIENNQLYVGMIGTGMVAAMVLNHVFNEGYKHVSWTVDASDDEVWLIHILCVHPKVKRRGLAKEMVCWAIEEAKRQKMKAIRLDVLKGNVPAERLYPLLGFKYITTERTYYDDLDWMDFLLYECPLEQISDDHHKIQSIVEQILNENLENFVSADEAIDESMIGLKLFEEPIMAFGSSEDPLFEKCKDLSVVGPWHWLPKEWLPGAKTVVSFFFPFSEKIKSENQMQKRQPSSAWLHGRIEGQNYLDNFMRRLKERLAKEGIQCCIPAIDPRFKGIMAGNAGELYGQQDEQVYGSNWSERHAAYICGLGTFGLSKGLITRKGMAGRFASIIIDQEIEPTKRTYLDLYEYCTKCGACISRCPVHAITIEDGKNHKICSDWLDETRESYKPRYGCGLCQTKVPCESQIPVKVE